MRRCHTLGIENSLVQFSIKPMMQKPRRNDEIRSKNQFRHYFYQGRGHIGSFPNDHLLHAI